MAFASGLIRGWHSSATHAAPDGRFENAGLHAIESRRKMQGISFTDGASAPGENRGGARVSTKNRFQPEPFSDKIMNGVPQGTGEENG